MTNTELEQLKYPIGKLELPSEITKDHIANWISILEHFPDHIEHLVENLTDEQLDTPYRPEGWTIRQVIHHLADSHHHSYTRFKWASTENTPIIKAYDEQLWAELIDTKTAPIEMSLNYLRALHFKLVYFLKTMSMDDFNKSFIHPEGSVTVSLKQNVANYAWHSQHHYTHIEKALQKNGWK